MLCPSSNSYDCLLTGGLGNSIGVSSTLWSSLCFLWFLGQQRGCCGHPPMRSSAVILKTSQATKGIYRLFREKVLEATSRIVQNMTVQCVCVILYLNCWLHFNLPLVLSFSMLSSSAIPLFPKIPIPVLPNPYVHYLSSCFRSVFYFPIPLSFLFSHMK